MAWSSLQINFKTMSVSKPEAGNLRQARQKHRDRATGLPHGQISSTANQVAIDSMIDRAGTSRIETPSSSVISNFLMHMTCEARSSFLGNAGKPAKIVQGSPDAHWTEALLAARRRPAQPLRRSLFQTHESVMGNDPTMVAVKVPR